MHLQVKKLNLNIFTHASLEKFLLDYYHQPSVQKEIIELLIPQQAAFFQESTSSGRKGEGGNYVVDGATLVHKEKINLKVPIRLSFQGLPSFLCKEKLAKCT